MPSSLAAALAASKQGGPAAVNNTSGKIQGESPARPSQQDNKKDHGANLEERERATATNGPREKISKHDENSSNSLKRDGAKINDLIQREKTTPNEGTTSHDDDGVAKSNAKRGKKKKRAKASTSANNNGNGTGHIVFLCDIPTSDGEDDDSECEDHVQDNDGRRTRSFKRRGRKRGTKTAIPIKDANNSNGEIMFVCDIPSDSDDSEREGAGDDHYGVEKVDDDGGGDHADEDRNCKREVDDVSRNIGVMTDNRQKSTARSRGNGDSGKGGGRGRNDREPAQCNNLQRDINKSSGDGGIPSAPVNPGSMPTPWSIQAQAAKNNGATGFSKQGDGARNDRGPAHGNNLRRDNRGPAQGNNLRKETNKSSGDGGIPNLSMNPCSMPTPWSIKAQATNKNSDTGFSKQGGGERSGGTNPRSGNHTAPTREKFNDRYIIKPTENPSTMPYPWSARAEALRNNDTRDKIPRMHSEDNDAHAGHHPRDHFPAQGMSSRELIPTSTNPNLTVAQANTIIESGDEKDLAKFSSIKLESTAIKGRWADEDSDDE